MFVLELSKSDIVLPLRGLLDSAYRIVKNNIANIFYNLHLIMCHLFNSSSILVLQTYKIGVP